MNQTKLSKQQKKIIMILGNHYDKTKKKGQKDHLRGIGRMELKREATNTPGGAYLPILREGKTKDYKPMTNSANASVTRSLKSLKKRGILGALSGEHDIFGYDYTLSREGLRVYKYLKKQKKVD